MKEYQLSETQIDQARAYYFEYICQTVHNVAKENSASDEERYIVVGQLMREEFFLFIRELQKQIRKDLAAGKISRDVAETMDLEELLINSIGELNKKS